MNRDYGRTGIPRRVDPESVAWLLPSVIGALAEGSLPAPLAVAALIAGFGEGSPDVLSLRSAGCMEHLTDTFGSDYVAGYLDGFNCSESRPKAKLRYVQGLDDATCTRHLLRKLPWGRALLAVGRDWSMPLPGAV